MRFSCVEGSRREIAELLRGSYPSSGEERWASKVDALVEQAIARGLTEDQASALLQSWSTQFPQRRARWLTTEAALGDLEEILLGPRGPSANAWHRLRQIANWCFDHYVALAGLITVIATLFYGFAYTRFFRELGLTPEQAGLTPASIITRSVLGGLALTLAIALGIFACVVAVIPVREDSAASTDDGSWQALVLNAFFTFLGFAYLFGLNLVLGFSLAGAAIFGSIPIFFFLIFSFRPRRRDDRRRSALRPLRFDLDKYLTIFVVAAILPGVLLAGAATISEADYYGSRARDGYAVRDPTIFGLPFLGVRVEPAVLSWSSDPPRRFLVPRCVLYVGSSSNGFVFYDHRSGRTVEVQPSEVTVGVQTRAVSCDAPFNLEAPRVGGHGNDLRCLPGSWTSQLASTYDYAWILEGITLDRNHSRRDDVFKDVPTLLRNKMRCRVTATNPYGSESALSRLRGG